MSGWGLREQRAALNHRFNGSEKNFTFYLLLFVWRWAIRSIRIIHGFYLSKFCPTAVLASVAVLTVNIWGARPHGECGGLGEMSPVGCRGRAPGSWSTFGFGAFNGSCKFAHFTTRGSYLISSVKGFWHIRDYVKRSVYKRVSVLPCSMEKKILTYAILWGILFCFSLLYYVAVGRRGLGVKSFCPGVWGPDSRVKGSTQLRLWR